MRDLSVSFIPLEYVLIMVSTPKSVKTMKTPNQMDGRREMQRAEKSKYRPVFMVKQINLPNERIQNTKEKKKPNRQINRRKTKSK